MWPSQPYRSGAESSSRDIANRDHAPGRAERHTEMDFIYEDPIVKE
jgi:hypothetical protein